MPWVLWGCCLGSRKGIRPVKKLSAGGGGVVICLAHRGSPRQRAVKWACVCLGINLHPFERRIISCVYCPLKESFCDIFVVHCPGQKVPLYSSFVKNPLICFLCCPRNPQTESMKLKRCLVWFLVTYWLKAGRLSCTQVRQTSANHSRQVCTTHIHL